jgi:enoyl-CoA hydratase
MNRCEPDRGHSLADGRILQRVSDGVATVTINNPEKHNAMSLDMWHALGEAVDISVANQTVRVILLTGAGRKAFISGADIGEFETQRYDARSTERYASRGDATLSALERCRKPTIACIEGFCLGGGLLVAMLADIRIAAEGSQYGIPAARLGVAYGYLGLERLVSLVGPSRARLMMYTGDRIDAAEALRIGLVDEVVPCADLHSRIHDLAKTIIGNAPLSIAASKITIEQILRDPSDRDIQAIDAINARCADSDDFREGRRAFAEKRKPVFHGR